MRIKDIIIESDSAADFKDTTLKLGKYRGPYDPRTMEFYSADHADSSELSDEVDDLIDSGFKPQVVKMSPSDLTATQDWLSDEESDGPLFDEYRDKPVVLKNNQVYYILDGHHRVASALKTNSQIQVYLFDEIA